MINRLRLASFEASGVLLREGRQQPFAVPYSRSLPRSVVAQPGEVFGCMCEIERRWMCHVGAGAHTSRMNSGVEAFG